ncbi:hypothetical protein [Plesiomonas shigelloides]|uniref:hypothetical protein n=1 Tax=Plesiomonas shigelloides TaxID=703 RepID=UPI0012E0120B|nr:hypothetical protein [Plesiomonas shigelloides]
MGELLFFGNVFILGVVLISLLLVKKYLPSYLSEKGKNLATKEDVRHITDKIEQVKLEYASKLEGVKNELSIQLNNSSYRYRKEFDVLSELTSKIVYLKSAALCLRRINYSPVHMDVANNDLWSDYIKARNELVIARETNRPFYPVDIYNAIILIDVATYTESVQYIYSPSSAFVDDKKYREHVALSHNDIIKYSDEAIDKIRDRVILWESINQGDK